MIIEVPTSSDFMTASLNSLNLAWSIIIQLHFELKNAKVSDWDSDGDVTDEYWQKSQSPLGNALILVQQGFELSLKSRIAAVSPYLLLSKDLRDWPASDKKDISFSDFRTIDSADLIKLHNSISAEQLEPAFIERFDLIRKRRNQIIHHGKDRRPIQITELLEAILTCVARLAPSTRWMKQRSEYKNSDHFSVAYSSDHVSDELCSEAAAVIDLLGAAKLNFFFGFDKKARRYYCPSCARYSEADPYRTAHLRPNSSKSRTLFCMACDEIHEIQRQACAHPECKSNVISMDGTCLTCWDDQ